jgi:hypothetical protein
MSTKKQCTGLMHPISDCEDILSIIFSMFPRQCIIRIGMGNKFFYRVFSRHNLPTLKELNRDFVLINSGNPDLINKYKDGVKISTNTFETVTLIDATMFHVCPRLGKVGIDMAKYIIDKVGIKEVYLCRIVLHSIAYNEHAEYGKFIFGLIKTELALEKTSEAVLRKSYECGGFGIAKFIREKYSKAFTNKLVMNILLSSQIKYKQESTVLSLLEFADLKTIDRSDMLNLLHHIITTSHNSNSNLYDTLLKHVANYSNDDKIEIFKWKFSPYKLNDMKKFVEPLKIKMENDQLDTFISNVETKYWSLLPEYKRKPYREIIRSWFIVDNQ